MCAVMFMWNLQKHLLTFRLTLRAITVCRYCHALFDANILSADEKLTVSLPRQRQLVVCS